MTYSSAIRFLYGLRLFGAKFGLDNTHRLAALAGAPQDKLSFIHVAGTNGKGSTCAMLDAIYAAARVRVGLFTSPHLVSFRERIQIARQWISENDVVRLVEQFQPLLAQFPKDHHPTFFEVVTVMALKFFVEQDCSLVIWETGLGGRLDATNIVTPIASVITNIALDHQEWLGDTLEKIAFEKAGIIKPGIPVLTCADAPGALAIIKRIAIERNAPLTIVTAQAKPPVPALRGEHQKRNAALAAATAGALRGQIPVSDEQIRAGLQNVHWPGRLQTIQSPQGKDFLLDGAHNVAGIEALRQTVTADFGSQKRALILGILKDKDWKNICQIIAPLADRIFTVPVSSERTADPNVLAEACRRANPFAEVFVCDTLAAASSESDSRCLPRSDYLVLIAGSLYLVGEALELLGYFPSFKSERRLNEWSGEPSFSLRL